MEKKPQERRPPEQQPKRPYQKPAVRSTKLYETFVLGCDMADEDTCPGGTFGSTV